MRRADCPRWCIVTRPCCFCRGSLAIYAVAPDFRINVPTWPVEGTWFLVPLAWQLIYVLGFILAGDDGIGALVRRHRRLLWWAAVPVLLAGAFVALDALFAGRRSRCRGRELFFMFDKTFLSPARLIHMLALAAFFAGTFAPFARLMPQSTRYLSMLGRNSLNVFCIASLLSLAAQLFRFAYGGRVASGRARRYRGHPRDGTSRMGIGMARKDAGKAGSGAGPFLGACLFLINGGVAAEEPGASPLSAQCAAPSADIAGAGAARQCRGHSAERKVVNILAVGSSATYTGPSASKSYPAQLEELLEKALRGVDVEIVNRSVAGEVAETTAERIRSQVAITKARSRLVAVGDQ